MNKLEGGLLQMVVNLRGGGDDHDDCDHDDYDHDDYDYENYDHDDYDHDNYYDHDNDDHENYDYCSRWMLLMRKLFSMEMAEA